MSEEPKLIHNTEDDQAWADLLSPMRRRFIVGAGLSAAGLVAASNLASAQDPVPAAGTSFKPIVPPPDAGKSPWGYETHKEPTPRPKGLRPGEEDGLPAAPRPYTLIKSYHAHVYFDDDTFGRAALLRRWAAERFPVELGNWNVGPRGPHVTPSFYFGFTNDLLPIVVPWLQLNSLGLTILLHPNTTDPRADHLHYALWVNRSQPVNAFDMATSAEVEKIFPNTTPTVQLEI